MPLAHGSQKTKPHVVAHGQQLIDELVALGTLRIVDRSQVGQLVEGSEFVIAKRGQYPLHGRCRNAKHDLVLHNIGILQIGAEKLAQMICHRCLRRHLLRGALLVGSDVVGHSTVPMAT